MEAITPLRTQISDRFPVASFDVRCADDRLFEVACATDARLLHPSHAHHRTPENFYTSRTHGLMRAPRGRATWFLPPEQLRRFAGGGRVYYALGTYGDPNHREPWFSVDPAALDRAPSIALAADFTGRSLDRSRLRNATHARYGRREDAVLFWGGDAVLRASRAGDDRAAGYDDGFDQDLWQRPAPPAPPPTPASEPDRLVVGLEDAPCIGRHTASFGRVAGPPAAYGNPGREAAGPGLEDGADASRGAHANPDPGLEDAPAVVRAGQGRPQGPWT